MSLRKEQSLFIDDVVKLLNFAKQEGFEITGGELFRTPEQQEIYFRTGRSRTMNSYHLKKLAIDLNFFRNGELIQDKEGLQKLGNYWEELSSLNKWGGNFKTFVDTPH